MRSRILFLVASIFACLASGGLIGAFLIGPDAETGAPTFTPGATSTTFPASTPVSILVITVDSRVAVRPTLEGVWVITLTPGVSQYYLLGFPVDTAVGGNQKLVDYYNAGQNLTDACRFVDGVLKNISQGGIAVSYHVVLDRAMMEQMIDRMGGVALNGQVLNGAAVMQDYNAIPANDTRTQLEFQRNTLEAFTVALTAQPWTDGGVHELFAQHRETSPNSEVLLALALQALRLGQPQFNITTYQPPAQ